MCKAAGARHSKGKQRSSASSVQDQPHLCCMYEFGAFCSDNFRLFHFAAQNSKSTVTNLFQPPPKCNSQPKLRGSSHNAPHLLCPCLQFHFFFKQTWAKRSGSTRRPAASAASRLRRSRPHHMRNRARTRPRSQPSTARYALSGVSVTMEQHYYVNMWSSARARCLSGLISTIPCNTGTESEGEQRASVQGSSSPSQEMERDSRPGWYHRKSQFASCWLCAQSL